MAATALLVLVLTPASQVPRSPLRGPRGSCWPPDRTASARDNPASRAALLDRAKLMRILAVNRGIMMHRILIAVFLFFTAQGARAGDVTLAANAVLNNFLLISAFFLDGLANAAEQLCGRAYGARARDEFLSATRLVVAWGFGFALAVTASYVLFGPVLIDIMTASDEVRREARIYLWLVALAPVLGVFAFAYDGIYIGATWARDMRNLMVLSLLIFFGALALGSFGNTGRFGRAAGELRRAQHDSGAALPGAGAGYVADQSLKPARDVPFSDAMRNEEMRPPPFEIGMGLDRGVTPHPARCLSGEGGGSIKPANPP
jgi:hypothetical protein